MQKPLSTNLSTPQEQERRQEKQGTTREGSHRLKAILSETQHKLNELIRQLDEKVKASREEQLRFERVMNEYVKQIGLIEKQLDEMKGGEGVIGKAKQVIDTYREESRQLFDRMNEEFQRKVKAILKKNALKKRNDIQVRSDWEE